MNISYSRVSKYLRCPRAHYLSYIERLELDKPIKPLSFGSDFHKLLQYRRGKTKLKKAKLEIIHKFDSLPSRFQSELGDNYIDDLFTIFSDYRNVYRGEEKPIHTELEFSIPVGKIKGEQVNFIGYIDEIYDEYKVVGEHKTFGQKPSMDTLVMNPQGCLYAKAVELLYGKLPEKIRWDYIHSSPAKIPAYLKPSQRLSCAKDNRVTPFSWARACKLYNIVDEQEILKGENFQQNISNSYFRHDLAVMPIMVERTWETFRYVAKDIITRGKTNQTQNLTRDCGFCNFRDICHTEFTGGNVKYLIEKNYRTKEERH